MPLNNSTGNVTSAFYGTLDNTNQRIFGATTHYEYNKNRLLKVQINGSGTRNTSDSVNVSYEYYDDGKLKSITYPTLTDGTVLKSVYAYDGLSRLINEFDVTPIIENDRTLIPLRGLFEKMGASVEWNGENRTAIVKKNDLTLSIKIDHYGAEVNNTCKYMDVPARLVESRTMIPLRFLSEELGYTVIWNEEERSIEIEASKDSNELCRR